MSQDLAHSDVFQETRKVIEAFQNKEVGPALSWCAENKSRLKKSKVCILFFFCVRWWGDLAIIGVVLFEPKQWDYPVDQFKQEFCKLYGITFEPLLNIYLQAGLSALKTRYLFTDIYLISILLSSYTFNLL
ncbi:putative CTLH/CRA to LisH motif domain, protein Fyv10/Macrophage erythroblast attacher [Rosa chinensis]|uniref:Putative CTLH/CRA to LisH motif domain, protein Fyv10/Macrophage erythroblast attacher n=1 Tax=Rosa chinensis TaxID=74649 RepID=A0A2P6QGV9_ROSCH|nr:putative CTLH/CRA to LisH motif domain, protein Fyv10/Macrophage erythroblast attacher [Rosa chinensis]